MRICIGKKKDSTWCTHKAKYGHHCGYHHPDGYHKSPKIQHEYHVNDTKHNQGRDDLNEIKERMFGVERMLETLIKLHEDIMLRVSLTAEDTSCNNKMIKDIQRSLFPILAPLRVAVNTASWMPIVGRFVT